MSPPIPSPATSSAQALFFEHAACIGLIFDANGQLLAANALARRLSGCAVHELQARPDLLPPLAASGEAFEAGRFAQAVRRDRLEAQAVSRWVGEDGETLWIRWHHEIVRSGQSEPVRVISSGIDITAEATEIRSLRRGRDFTTFQARVNRALVHASDDIRLFDEITQLAVDYAGAHLAWVGRPDARQRFQVLASAGPAAGTYLDNILISTDPDVPEGRGPWGRVWREERVLFYRSFSDSAAFAPWQARATASGLESSVTLPIRRGGRMWAVCAVYLPETLWVDPDLRAILEALAKDLSQGLDALDARTLNMALTRHTNAAIAVVTRRRLDYVNPRFAQLFGAGSTSAMIGQPTRGIYSDPETYRRIGVGYAEIDRQGVVRFQDVPCRRRDGTMLLCDMIGTRLSGETTVWTWIDVTDRARQQRQIERLSRYNALLAQVNHLISQEPGEQHLLQRICELAVRQAGVSLAWIGRPDAQARLQFLASAGPARGYLDGICISTDPHIPEGRGGVGQVWRSGAPYWFADFARDVPVRPWVERAAEHNLRATVVLPIRRQGHIWAVLALYADEAGIFDERLRAVLQQLSNHISTGLDLADLARRERETGILNALLLDGMNVGVLVMRYPERTIEHANLQWLRMACVDTAEALASREIREFYPDEATYRDVGELAEEVLKQGQAARRDVAYRSLDGETAWHDIFGHRLERGDGVQRIIWTHVDVTERHRNETALRALSSMRATLLSNTVVGINLVRYPERVVIEANAGLLRILGYRGEPHDMIGQSVDVIYAQASENRRMADVARKVLDAGSGSLSDVQVRRRDGKLIYLDLHGRRLDGSDPHHPVIVWTSVDVTERHSLAQELSRQALFDTLTDLPNRRALEQHLGLAIARARRRGTQIAVGMLDLDDFKPVNDQYGHAIGDVLLQQFAVRLRDRLRKSDFVARVGGDEFVAVLEDIDREASSEALSAVWVNLHQAVEAPFKFGGARQARVEMSMGVALYPADGQDADTLLREADAAMYQAKAHKLDRAHWWRLNEPGETVPDESEPFDTFGRAARDLLAQISPHLAAAGKTFAESFYGALAAEPETAPILANLSAEEFAGLKRAQADHLRFLLAPATTEQVLAARARKVGEIHALSGVTPDAIAGGITLYGERLCSTLEGIAATARSRYRAVRSADARLRLDMQTQLRAMQQVMDTYHAHTARPLPAPGSWASLAQQELDALATLPGIRACQVMRPDGQGRFTIEMSAGAVSGELVRAVQTQSLLPRQDERVPTGQGLINAAWQTGSSQRSDAYARDRRTGPWHEQFAALGVRSLLAVPVHGNDAVSFVLVIEGAHVNQFRPGWMQSFAASLSQRWRQVETRATLQPASLQQSEAEGYRQLFHSGGLCLLCQPIVRLDTGEVTGIEALARLMTPGGDIISPQRFLPAFRDSDFHQLFCQGLDRGLARVPQWRTAGLDVGVSLNIGPATLVHPDCAAWVTQALQRHDVAAHCLTLEVLETQEFDERRHDAAIARLKGLGVRLAMDDLGSGYSSLKRLARLPVDVIKVDQALVREMASEPLKTLTLLSTILLIGRDLEREVVIEGLEDAPMLRAARLLGAPYAQGYAIATPMPAAELPAWHDTWRQAWTPSPELKTYLEALAYYRRRMHDADTAPLLDHVRCPLSTFLRAREPGTGEAVRWHRQVHEARSRTERHQARRSLTAWLAQRVRDERTG